MMVEDLSIRINVSKSVAEELLDLAGGDVDLAEECSLNSKGLNQCKSKIIGERFARLERKIDNAVQQS